MKLFVKIILVFLLSFPLEVHAGDNKKCSELELCLEQFLKRIDLIHSDFLMNENSIHRNIVEIDKELAKDIALSKKIELLIKRTVHLEEIEKLKEKSYLDISKIRYLKGIDIIKILYEKVLSLDHHFSSVRSFSAFSKLSNPNNYAPFSKLRTEIKRKARKQDQRLELSELLGNNLIANVTQTFINMTNTDYYSNMNKDERHKLDCILDFTLRMYNDLNTVYYETAFLQVNNANIKIAIEHLFKDYTKSIGYLDPLGECRAKDDWDNLRTRLDEEIQRMNMEDDSKKVYRRQVDIEFSIDRLLQFIIQYNAFIEISEQFYSKFRIILNSYENHPICEENLQSDFTKLKGDIEVAIDKFRIAYKPIEINGSKMKGILYGLNNYE